ncbi:TIGR03758 family integrating conjugative element protein [Ectothiorhodospira variabilis]|uniref:TIGR03758 family integrating conjugative element protein n=1 Tax=Ectothiorhodospira variabilis TaxID=505694 RepID=UPI001EFA76FE|nr:TIGR03758 family integrating conjugative element protein [Ectothiorhodospira variabilis]MCG5505167.1 TIGR03758 family integrating conjugative element protein [Ectothiorhodospira variabilis]MCG5508324.1 TIGR03758 family integrating conjugative element protein [Ectothiorhodospira variabilis]
MNADQQSAFEAAAGVGLDTLALTLASISAVLYLLWLAWTALTQYRAWNDKRATFFDMTWLVIRATILVLLLGFFIRP